MDKGVWEGYPTDALKMPVGVWAFYVAQMGFWGDGLLNTISGSREVERRDDKKRPNGLAPRKRDIKQCSEKAQELWALRIHHTTALVLLLTSHFMHFWRIGHLIITLMDISDVLLSLAKSLRYVQYQLPCDITFAMFALSWFVTRHALYARILWSTLFESVRRIPVKTFDPWGTGSWFHWGVYWFYAVVLVGLQGLMVRWGWMIIGVLGRVLVGKEAADSRSDDECESEEESNEKKKEEGARVDSEDESLERLSVADEDLVDAMFLKDSDKDASSATRFLNNK
ncbi:TLC domain-containing protein [Chytridium lagenaria]|nr:TLC domain-containing protein [Chytridium lagenaria]